MPKPSQDEIATWRYRVGLQDDKVHVFRTGSLATAVRWALGLPVGQYADVWDLNPPIGVPQAGVRIAGIGLRERPKANCDRFLTTET